MGDPLFISQAKLEGWIGDGEVTFVDNVLTLPAQGVSYTLEPAVHITQLLDGEDSLGLIGQIRSQAELVERGAEIYRTSLILGETAYECEEGYVGTRSGASAEAPVAEAAEAAPQPSSDMELLTDFLLKNM